jgi:hypothetical protein
MSEEKPIVPDDPHGDAPRTGAEGQGLSPRVGWRERVYGIKGVAAVAVAGLIVGGGAGAAIHAAVGDDGGRDGRPGFMRNGGPGGGPGFAGPGGGQQGPGQGQGQLPQPPGGMPAQPPGMPQQPATPPEDGVSPDSSGDTTSGNNT